MAAMGYICTRRRDLSSEANGRPKTRRREARRGEGERVSGGGQRQCGECGLCCKVVAYPELDKPRGVWCRHYLPHKGCGIHETRPDVCRRFFCLWITNAEFGEEWQPNKAGFFMWEDRVQNGRRLILEVDGDRPNHWMRQPYLNALRQIADRRSGQTVEVIVRTRGKVKMLFPEGLVDLGDHKELPVRSGYRAEGGKLVPYAEYVEA